MQTISFVATGLVSNKEKHSEVDKNNIAVVDDYRLLKTIGVYGANASGKSNIIRALSCFKGAVRALPSPQSQLSEVADPFLFQEDAENTESFFQIVFLLLGKKYRYGFTVKKNTKRVNLEDSAEIITSEWLYGPKEKNQVPYFIREGLNITKANLQIKENIPDLQFQHSLFLTHVASFDKGVFFDIWNFICVEFSNQRFRQESLRIISTGMLKEENSKKEFLHFLSNFNLDYSDIIIDDKEDLKVNEITPQEKIFLSKNNMPGVYLNLKTNESEGTKKLFDLAGTLIFLLKMQYPCFLILDELDSNFHPALVIKIIELFNNPEINKGNCQLLFSSHDTNLLNPAIMRRDQFYFTEKTEDESTRLYSLADLKGIRNDADFAKQYLAGYYGAVPVLKDFVNEKNEN
jgi:hypothetical protein